MNSTLITPYYNYMILYNKTYIGTKKRLTSKLGITIFPILIFYACVMPNHKILVMDYFDNDDRSITMTNEVDYFTIGIKESFLNNNWYVSIFTQTEGTDYLDFSSIETRYIMLLDYTIGYDLLYGNFIKDYKVTIYDTIDTSEIVILYGDGCTLESLLLELKDIIEGNYST